MNGANGVALGTGSNARRLISIGSIILAATIFGLTYGLTAPLIAVDLAARGYGELMIGANAAMHAVGVLLIAAVLPRMAARFNPRLLLLLALAASASILVLFPSMPSVWLWFPLRIGLGVAAEILFVLTETWTNDLSTDSSRGRTMAVYTASLSLGFAGGPAILSVFGTGSAAYWIGAAITALAVIPLLQPWLMAPPPMEPSTKQPWQYFRIAPIAVTTTLLNAAVETAGLSFIALYAAGLGWSEKESLQLVSTLMVGAILLQIPIGFLADRLNPRRLAWILAALSAAGAFAWPWALGTHWLAYAMVFAWGGVFVGIYTVMLTIVGSRYSGSELVGIYSVMSVAWGAGALIGPSLAGAAMSISPFAGLPYAIGIGCTLFTVFMMINRSET